MDDLQAHADAHAPPFLGAQQARVGAYTHAGLRGREEEINFSEVYLTQSVEDQFTGWLLGLLKFNTRGVRE